MKARDAVVDLAGVVRAFATHPIDRDVVLVELVTKGVAIAARGLQCHLDSDTRCTQALHHLDGLGVVMGGFPADSSQYGWALREGLLARTVRGREDDTGPQGALGARRLGPNRVGLRTLTPPSPGLRNGR